MEHKRSIAAARKRLKPTTRWGWYMLAGALLLAVLGAAGAADRMLATSASAEPFAAAATAPVGANVGAASSAAGESGSAQTLYAHGDRLRPLVEVTGGVQTLNIYGPGGQIIAQVARDGQDGQEARHLLADHPGSTRAALDGDGNAVARFEYGPHGDTTASGTAAVEVRYRYTGHAYDEEQGVYETPARGYDPTTGRFLSVDPQRQDASPYVYAGNNPVGYLDPTGGGRVPYFMKSGMKKSHGMVARSIANLFGVHKRQDIGPSTAFKKSKKTGRSTVRKDVKRFLYGDTREGREVRKFKFNEKFFWIMGEEEDVPDDLYEVFTSVRKRQEYKSFANKIILLDFTGTKKSKDILTEFEDRNESALLIKAEIAYGWDDKNRTASGFKVDGSDLGPSQFQAHVEDKIVRKWPEGSTSMPSAPMSDDSLLVSIPLEHMNSFLRFPATRQIAE